MTTTITHKRGDTFAHTVLLPASVAAGRALQILDAAIVTNEREAA